MMLSAEYSAGIFDGEGTVYAAVRNSKSKYRPSPTVLVCLSNTHRGVLDALQSQWSGTINERKVKFIPNRRVQYQWALSARKAYPFLKAIEPHLIIKKEIVRVAIKLSELMQLPHAERVDYTNTVERGGRKWVSPIAKPEFSEKTWLLHGEIKELNKRGAPFNSARQWDA